MAQEQVTPTGEWKLVYCTGVAPMVCEYRYRGYRLEISRYSDGKQWHIFSVNLVTPRGKRVYDLEKVLEEIKRRRLPSPPL